jgi:hypothetical protein
MRYIALVAAAAGSLFAPDYIEAAVITSSTVANGFNFTSLDDSADPTFNQLLGINNTGLIVGYFGSGAAGHPNQGFEIAAPYANFVDLNFPGSVQTQVTGLNNSGRVVGFGSDTNIGVGLDNNFGFFARPLANSFTKLTDPVSAGAPPVVQLLGVNDHNTAAGFFNDAGGNAHGFTVDLGNLAVMPVAVPDAVSLAATGISNGGKISGFFSNAAGNTLGFVENTDGTGLVTFEAPGSVNTQFLGVNNEGKAVGFFNDAADLSHGIVFDTITDTLTIVDDPNAQGGTVINGINDKNELVGFFVDGDGNTHGLLVTVGEPSSSAILGIATMLIVGAGWLTRRRSITGVGNYSAPNT